MSVSADKPHPHQLLPNMRTTVISLGFAHLLSTAIAQEWQVAAYTSQRCNGEQLSLHEPIQQPADDRECRFFTHHVATTSVAFSVSEDNTDTWIFGLHSSPNDDSCVYDQEGAGSYTRTFPDEQCLVSL
jgi:hypothetical protein